MKYIYEKYLILIYFQSQEAKNMFVSQIRIVWLIFYAEFFTGCVKIDEKRGSYQTKFSRKGK